MYHYNLQDYEFYISVVIASYRVTKIMEKCNQQELDLQEMSGIVLDVIKLIGTRVCHWW
jgi:hypothetical protein